MSAFDHVLVLLSFVYALALTHLLSRIGALALARARVRWSGLLALAMTNAILFIFANWLSLWDLRGLKEWDLFSMVTQFLFAVGAYFICAFSAPETGEEAIDMEAFYWTNHRLYYGAAFACLLLSFVVNAEFLKTPNPSLFLEENMFVLPMLPFIAMGLLMRVRWAHWIAGAGFFALLVGYTIRFSSTLT